MWYLCSGKTWANPSAASMDRPVVAFSSFFTSPRPAASRMSVPRPTFAEASCGEVVDGRVDGGLDGRGVRRQGQDHLGGTLADLERGGAGVTTGDGGLGPFVDRVERLEVR